MLSDNYTQEPKTDIETQYTRIGSSTGERRLWTEIKTAASKVTSSENLEIDGICLQKG